MPKFTVRMSGYQDASIKVEAEDPDDAIDGAIRKGVPGMCAHCSGWGMEWSRDESDEWIPYEVDDETGATAWSGPTGVGEAVIRELSSLRTSIIQLSPSSLDGALELIDARTKKLKSGEL
jgi:hypothetical protein